MTDLPTSVVAASEGSSSGTVFEDAPDTLPTGRNLIGCSGFDAAVGLHPSADGFGVSKTGRPVGGLDAIRTLYKGENGGEEESQDAPASMVDGAAS